MSAEANNPEGPAPSVRGFLLQDGIPIVSANKNGTARAHPSESIGCSGAL
jgi:hypothetical protein